MATTEPETADAVEAAKAKKSKPNKFLPTDRIAPGRQLEILRAYAAASGPNNKVVTNAEVADILKMSGSTVALANPFFTENGLLQKAEGGFVPAADVHAFLRAFDWNPERAAEKLAPTVGETWFAKALTPRVSFRTVTEDEAIEVLAEACNAAPEYKAQLKTLLDYLQAAGLVQREGGQVRANKGQPMPAAPSENGHGRTPSLDAKETAATPTPTKAVVTTAFATPTEGVVQFHVAVRVDMKEFAGWSPDRISAFFNGIAQVLAAKGAIEKEVSV